MLSNVWASFPSRTSTCLKNASNTIKYIRQGPCGIKSEAVPATVSESGNMANNRNALDSTEI